MQMQVRADVMMWASPGADVGCSQHAWAGQPADVAESRRRCGARVCVWACLFVCVLMCVC